MSFTNSGNTEGNTGRSYPRPNPNTPKKAHPKTKSDDSIHPRPTPDSPPPSSKKIGNKQNVHSNFNQSSWKLHQQVQKPSISRDSNIALTSSLNHQTPPPHTSTSDAPPLTSTTQKNVPRHSTQNTINISPELQIHPPPKGTPRKRNWSGRITASDVSRHSPQQNTATRPLPSSLHTSSTQRSLTNPLPTTSPSNKTSYLERSAQLPLSTPRTSTLSRLLAQGNLHPSDPKTRRGPMPKHIIDPNKKPSKYSKTDIQHLLNNSQAGAHIAGSSNTAFSSGNNPHTNYDRLDDAIADVKSFLSEHSHNIERLQNGESESYTVSFDRSENRNVNGKIYLQNRFINTCKINTIEITIKKTAKESFEISHFFGRS